MFIAANWKMNYLRKEAEQLAEELVKAHSARHDVLICPPFTLLDLLAKKLNGSGIKLGAQDCHDQSKGAYTGDISAEMLADAGATHVILGHSERRNYHKESDELVQKKAAAAIRAGLIPVICIGETLEERKAGNAEAVVAKQMGFLPQGNIILAYEPVWAIGTGVTPTVAEIEAMHGFIATKRPDTKILYGGSVTEANCKEISLIPNVSGFLVGGASLDVAKFTKIMEV